jgi:hypothetical protein
MKASRETFKLKTAEGEVKVAVLGDSPGPEEYLQHINSFLRNLTRRKWDAKMTKSIRAVQLATASMTKFAKVPANETGAMTATRSASLAAAVEKRKQAEAHETQEVGLVYDLFRKQLKEDPELQWDRIVEDMHVKDPWEDLRGVKHTGLRRKSYASLWECIDFHKLTVYSVDAAERQRFYMLCNLKKPAKSIIRSHVTRMETLNKYLEQLPTIKNSPMAVASTEYGNVPFNESTLASIILSHLPVAWRNQYNLTHTIVPESPRAILLDLENLEKVFAERSNEAARANKAKVLQPPNWQVTTYPGRGNVRMGEGPTRGTPRRAVPTSFASGARLLTGRSRLTTPQSVVGSTRTAVQRTGLLSPSIPRRSPGRNQGTGTPIR